MERGNVLAGYLAAIITFLTGLTVNEFVSLAGLLIGVATFITNWVYKHRHLQLEQQRIDALNAKIMGNENG